MAHKLFGTDGIRGIAGTYPLSVDFCTRFAAVLSTAICTIHKKVALARDTRISGDMLFSALAAGFCSQGVDVIDLGIIPTPLCTTLTPHLNVDLSIMITASHNPYQDNGLKLITPQGDKFSDRQTSELEELLNDTDYQAPISQTIGRIIKTSAGLENYLATVSRITSPNALQGLKIVLDSANGAFSEIMPPVFENLGAEIISLSASPDGTNINLDCGSQHTENLSKTIVSSKADIGIAVDGDGDRIIICDEKGNRLDGDQIIAYLATYFQQHQLLKGNAVVATIYSNLGLGKYIRSLGLDYYAAAVGERYVIEKMREVGANVGGEESGHMVLSDYSLTGDALLCAIIICLGLKASGKKVSEIFPLFAPFPSQTNNLKFTNRDEVNHIINHPGLQKLISEIKNELQGHGTLIVRPSGTEPVIRLKIEDENIKTVESTSERILTFIKSI